MELIPFIVIILASLLAGFVGAHAGGGGMITLPIFLILGIPVPNAIAINNFGGLFQNLFASFEYERRKKFPIKIAILLGIPCIFGAILGTYTALTIDEVLLKKTISIILILLLFVVTFKKEIGLEDAKLHIPKKYLVILIPVLFLIGMYGAAIGMATVTFLAFFFIFQKQSFSQSMGLALFMGGLIAASSTIVFIANDALIFKYAIPSAIAVAIGSDLGARFAIKKGNRWIKYVFVVVATVLVVKLLIDLYL